VREIADNEFDLAAGRLPGYMTGVAIASSLAAAATGHIRFAAGFVVGATAAILAYRWLHRAVAAALDSAEARPARTLMLKFAMRYPLLIMVAVLCYQTGWLRLQGVITGLFVPAAGALIGCVVVAAKMIRRGWTRPEQALPAPGSGASAAQLRT
jgi:hypothetical protein